MPHIHGNTKTNTNTYTYTLIKKNPGNKVQFHLLLLERIRRLNEVNQEMRP